MKVWCYYLKSSHDECVVLLTMELRIDHRFILSKGSEDSRLTIFFVREYFHYYKCYCLCICSFFAVLLHMKFDWNKITLLVLHIQ